MVYSVAFVIYGIFRYLYLVHVKKLGDEPEKSCHGYAAFGECAFMDFLRRCITVQIIRHDIKYQNWFMDILRSLVRGQ